jgi:hypothetical protein
MKQRGRPFPKGQSGNPGGRPRELRDVIELARSHSADAIATLAKIMRNEQAPPAARLGAAAALLDRGYGKPCQSVDLTFQPPALEKLSDEQLEQFEQLLMIAKPDGVEALPAPSPRGDEMQQHP